MCWEKSLASRILQTRLNGFPRPIWCNRVLNWQISCGTPGISWCATGTFGRGGQASSAKGKRQVGCRNSGRGDARFQFVVISAGPRQVVQSALEGIVPPENVYGTEFGYDSSGVEITSVERVPAGYGKVVVLQELEQKFGIRPDQTIAWNPVANILQDWRRDARCVVAQHGPLGDPTDILALISETAIVCPSQI